MASKHPVSRSIEARHYRAEAPGIDQTAGDSWRSARAPACATR